MFHMEQKIGQALKVCPNFFIYRCKKAVPNRYIPRCLTLLLLRTPCNAHQG